MYDIMTPGPTQVRENVLAARALPCTNPDLDPDFFTFYKETCELISSLLHTGNQTLILGGEGILGLEAACASLTEPGDRVLVLDNGVFGKGFADFVRIYGGEPVLYTTDYRHTLDVDALAAFLEKDHDFKYATVVHCDTPSGILNDISQVGGQAVLGRQNISPTPWLTKRHGYDPTCTLRCTDRTPSYPQWNSGSPPVPSREAKRS